MTIKSLHAFFRERGTHTPQPFNEPNLAKLLRSFLRNLPANGIKVKREIEERASEGKTRVSILTYVPA